jgi:hypothetical protein
MQSLHALMLDPEELYFQPIECDHTSFSEVRALGAESWGYAPLVHALEGMIQSFQKAKELEESLSMR